MILFRKLVDLEDGRLMSQNNHLGGSLDPRFFYRTEKGRS